MANSTPSGDGVAALLDDYSVEMTGKDDKAITENADSYAPGTRVNVTYLANEDLEMRVRASKAVKDAGYVPVPHISARRLHSRDELEEFLSALRDVGATESVFVVGGDPAEPVGPYADSLSVIQTGLLQQYGVKHVSIAGHPEGHPDVAEDIMRQALRDKFAALREQQLDGTILTQFSFDIEPIMAWVDAIRRDGIDLPLRIGVPGPAGIRRLLAYSKRMGVATSAGIASRYGFSITNLLGTAGPDRLIRDIAAQLKPEHGKVGLHFYTFGGLKTTGEWIKNFQKQAA